MESNFWLRGGAFTREEDPIRRVVKKIFENRFNSNKHYHSEISDYISRGLGHDISKKDEEFRKRTASEIIESGYWNGCTDRALVFVTLARSLGVPSKYVETYDEDWLENPDMNHIRGHIFTEILLGNDWKVYDPSRGFTPDNRYNLNDRKYVKFGEGLDFSELYVEGKEKPINLQVIDERVLEILKK